MRNNRAGGGPCLDRNFPSDRDFNEFAESDCAPNCAPDRRADPRSKKSYVDSGPRGSPREPPLALVPGDRVVILATGRRGTVLDGRCGPGGRVVVLPDRLADERHGAAVVVADRGGVRAEAEQPIEPAVVAGSGRDKGHGQREGRGMLVLTRKLDEVLVIDTGRERIEVMVVGFTGQGVRLGVQAPRSVTIHRAEVQDRIDRRRADGAKKGGAA